DEIAALGFRDRREVVFPGVWENVARAFLIEPVDLELPAEEDAAQDQAQHALGVRHSVGEAEGAAPAAAEHDPAADAEILADLLDVADKVPGRVLAELRMRRALAGAALVEEYHAVMARVEEAPIGRREAAAGTAVQEHDRHALGIADLLDVDRVEVGDLEVLGAIGLDLRKKFSEFHFLRLEFESRAIKAG